VRCVVQKVSSASVRCSSGHFAEIGTGLVVFIGFAKADQPALIPKCVEKIRGLRIFNDSAGKMNVSASEVGAEAFVRPNHHDIHGL